MENAIEIYIIKGIYNKSGANSWVKTEKGLSELIGKKTIFLLWKPQEGEIKSYVIKGKDEEEGIKVKGFKI